MTDRHIPPWDEPVSGYDAGSIGEHWIHRWIPEVFKDPDREKIGKICRSIDEMLRDATEYGAAQVRYRFLCPRRVPVYSGDTYVGAYYECRFCLRMTTESDPDTIDHGSTCLLVDRGERRLVLEKPEER